MGKLVVLGIQHCFVMFGATTLVPILTGIPVSVALFTAGLGTLIFHFITGGKVPVFLGSSFAFIAPIIAVTSYHADSANPLAYATGGLLLAGLVYMLMSFVVKKIGVEKVGKVFTPVVTGSMIMLIGLMLAPVAIDMASSNWMLAIVALVTAIIVKMYTKGFISMLPVLAGIGVGYLVGIITGNVSVEFSGVLAMPEFFLPKFSLFAISAIVPAAIAPCIEHFGDIYAISNVVDKPFYKEPGMHKTLLGDGIATSIAGLLGGPANTTYSENTGALAFTGVYNPMVMRIAAICAIVMSFVPAVGAVVSSIPLGVIGGISILLFGMIAAVGAKTWVTHKVDFSAKNIIIVAVMMVLGLGGANIQMGNFSLQGLGLAAVVGIILQYIWRKA